MLLTTSWLRRNVVRIRPVVTTAAAVTAAAVALRQIKFCLSSGPFVPAAAVAVELDNLKRA